MRLTLRTLLAWLDDTLPATEVRQIGKQVAESPFAQELVDRTYRVTRQRRLLVPSTIGPEATDPNLVAAYLDNELAPEDVAEYEKRCLTSDVNLAEVASVHQILSLIGQKAKVPPDARQRMYRLVRGRESGHAQPPSPSSAHAPAPAARRPAASRPGPWTPTIPSWSGPSATSRPLVERAGIAALVLALLGVIVWAAYTTLSPESDRPARLAQADPAPKPTTAEPAEPPKEPAPPPATTPPPATAEVASAEPAPAKAVETRTGVARLADADALVLAWDDGRGDWSRLAAATPIKEGARLLNLAPFWSTIRADSVRVTLVDEAEVRYLGGDRRTAIRLGFERGRAVVSGGPDGVPYSVAFAGKTCSILNAPGGAIGLERTWTPTPGVVGGAAPMVLYVKEGEVGLQVGDVKTTATGPSAVTWTEAGGLRVKAKAALPPWLTEAGPPPSAKGLGERFLKDFSPKGPVLRDLVQAVDGEDPDVRRLAIRALGAVGDAEMIVPVLNNATTDPATRRAAADVLRSMLARGGEPARAVRDELTKVFGAELAGPAEKLLVGFTPEEAAREATYVDLVRVLATPELGTRELALHALMALTGRDSLEYDPVNPEGRGLKAWQDLARQKELLKVVPPPASAR